MKYLLFFALLAIGCASKKAMPTITARDVPATTPDQDEVMIDLQDDEPQPELIRIDLDIKPVYFEFDSYLIQYIKPIKEAADYFIENNVKILLEGHACEIGTAEYNMQLGELRARAVRETLINMGCPPERIEIISYGEEKPVSKDLALNRRVEFKIK